jgi:beta-glucosidase
MLRTPDGNLGSAASTRTAPFRRARPIPIDTTLDFAWGNGSPATGLSPDDFSVRWTGKLVPKTSGNYVLAITGDDGYRLSLDGKVLVEDWTDHGSRARGAVTALEAGRSYDLVLEFYEHAGGADLHFSSAFVQNGAADAVKAAREADAVIFFAAVDPLAADEEAFRRWRSPTINRSFSMR